MTDDARKRALEALMYAHKMLTHMNVPTGLVTEAIAALSSAAPSAAEPVATQAARDVLAERQRQISTEGYTPEHDDEHGAEEFGRAASVYANSHVYDVIGASYMGWPWDEAWYKPTTQRRNFVKAAALLLAGIECIDRAAGIAAPPAPQAASEPVLPHPGSPEASAIIDSKLAEYNWPSNSKNAARAGFEAARALLAARPVKPMRAAEMAGAAAKEHMKFLNGLTEAETRATASVAWLPTSENINALPEPVRDYIHSLIANCDPAGNVADNAIKADTIRALEASNRRIRDELDTPGNRNPEARYAGYRGEPALDRYTADELAAWEEGQRARVPASKSVAGLSGDSEREALTDEQIDVLLRQEFGGHYDASDEVATRLRNILRQACRVVVSAIHSTGKPEVGGRLKKEARVGHTMFSVGVPERMVVEAAQRAAEHPQGDVDREFAAELNHIIQVNAERAAFLDSHPAVSAELAALIEENERLRAATADAPVAEPVAGLLHSLEQASKAIQAAQKGTSTHAQYDACASALCSILKVQAALRRPTAPEEGKDAARHIATAIQREFLSALSVERIKAVVDAAMAQGARP